MKSMISEQQEPFFKSYQNWQLFFSHQKVKELKTCTSCVNFEIFKVEKRRIFCN